MTVPVKIGTKETIAAVATPIGEGAVAVIRLSGAGALRIADMVFRGSVHLREVPGHTVHFGRIVDREGELVDEVLATVFREPNSYTGENAVEFGCHGGILVTNRVLETVLTAGARQADPGEFTKRAFLNGKMDLSQAEAVADLIAAKSERAHAASLAQLEGRLAGRVRGIRKELVDLCSLLELDLDFSEEGIDLISKKEIGERIKSVDNTLAAMAESFELGKIYRDGVTIVLAGRPNAGKSSLFNCLLKENRAIVTHVPGTTRDSLEENITLDGILFRIIDTAGLRDTDDIVEVEGVGRSKASLQRADIVLEVVDATTCQQPSEPLAELGGLNRNQKVVITYTKVDLVDGHRFKPRVLNVGDKDACEVLVSSKTGEGIDDLRRALVSIVTANRISPESSMYITTQRHLNAICASRKSLGTALESLSTSATNEFVAFDVREAIGNLSEITGEVTNEEILNNIFSKFCIGK